jgi:hypothetical protein
MPGPLRTIRCTICYRALPCCTGWRRAFMVVLVGETDFSRITRAEIARDVPKDIVR